MTNIELETLSLAKAALRKYNADEIDWEQRRYEIAKAVLSNPQMIESSKRTVGSCTYTVNDIDKTIDKAVAIADKLIEKLKGGKPCE